MYYAYSYMTGGYLSAPAPTDITQGTAATTPPYTVDIFTAPGSPTAPTTTAPTATTVGNGAGACCGGCSAAQAVAQATGGPAAAPPAPSTPSLTAQVVPSGGTLAQMFGTVPVWAWALLVLVLVAIAARHQRRKGA